MPFEFVKRDELFANYSLLVRGKDSFGYSIHDFTCLKGGYLDAKFENSKLGRVCCKILNLSLFSKSVNLSL